MFVFYPSFEVYVLSQCLHLSVILNIHVLKEILLIWTSKLRQIDLLLSNKNFSYVLKVAKNAIIFESFARVVNYNLELPGWKLDMLIVL